MAEVKTSWRRTSSLQSAQRSAGLNRALDPSRYMKSARSSPSPTKEFASSVKSQSTARCKTTPPSQDTDSTTRAGVRRSDTASSRSSALKPDLAQRQSGLMLIAPVNTDTVMRSVQDVVHARARHHSSRHVSHCAAELKIRGLCIFPPCGNGTVNENGIKEEPETNEGQRETVDRERMLVS